MEQRQSFSPWAWFATITFSVVILCQFSWIQAAFNPTMLAMSSSKAKSEKKSASKKTADKKKAKKSKKSKKGLQSYNTFNGNKTLKKIYGRQARRARTIDAFKKKGAVGEADSGLLKVRSTKGLSKKEKEILGKFVKAENGDRTRIMAEIEKGGYPTKKSKQELRRNMFRFNREADVKGTYFYEADHWHKKE